MKVAWERHIPEIHFRDATLSEVTEQLGHHFPEINFVMNENIAGHEVSLSLRNVTLEDILKALSLASDGFVRGQRVDDRLVSVLQRTQKPDPVTLQAFNLRGYLGGLDEKQTQKKLIDLYDVLESSWQMLREADKGGGEFKQPKIQIHRATELLIVVGTPDQLEVTANVVKALPNNFLGELPSRLPSRIPKREDEEAPAEQR